MASPGPGFMPCPRKFCPGWKPIPGSAQSHRYPNAPREFRCKNTPSPGCRQNYNNNSNWIYIPPPYSIPPPCPSTRSPSGHYPPRPGHPPSYPPPYNPAQSSLPLTPPQLPYPPFPQMPHSSQYTLPPPPFPPQSLTTPTTSINNYLPPSQLSPPPIQSPEPSHTPPLPPPSYTPPPLPLSPPPLPPSPPPLPPSPPPAVPPLPPSPPPTPCINDSHTSADQIEFEESKNRMPSNPKENNEFVCRIKERDEDSNRKLADFDHPHKIEYNANKRKSISSCDDEVCFPNKYKKIGDFQESLSEEEKNKTYSSFIFNRSPKYNEHYRNKYPAYVRKNYSHKKKKGYEINDFIKTKSFTHSVRRSSCDSHQSQRKEEMYFNSNKNKDFFHIQGNHFDSKNKRRISLDIPISDKEDTDGNFNRKRSWKKVYESLKLDEDSKTSIDGSLKDLTEAYDSYYNLNDHQEDSYDDSHYNIDDYQKESYNNSEQNCGGDKLCSVKSEIHVVKNTWQTSSLTRKRYDSMNDSNFDTESIYSTDESDNASDKSNKKKSRKNKFFKKLTYKKCTSHKYEDKNYGSDNFYTNHNSSNEFHDSDSSLGTSFGQSYKSKYNHCSKPSKSSKCISDSQDKANEIRNEEYSTDKLISKEEDYVDKWICKEDDSADTIISKEDSGNKLISKEEDSADELISKEKYSADNLISKEKLSADKLMRKEEDSSNKLTSIKEDYEEKLIDKENYSADKKI
ncbi:unnamed protein product, partial [Meganyctiphanes norvegica]